MEIYTHEQIQLKLVEIPGWIFNGKELERDLKFANFNKALEAMNKIGAIAEKMNHHPHWTNTYNRLNIKLSTHDVEGITDKDFALAKRINELTS